MNTARPDVAVNHRYYRLKDGNRIHYLHAGRYGVPVVLLHPSPLSSRFMIPLLQTLALGADAQVIAPDTPGYGYSDPLPSTQDGLQPYVEVLEELLAGLNIESVVLYGSSTGAQIAIEYGKAYPQRLAGLILDNAAHFEDDEREAITRDYFPDRTPRDDGSHLAGHWLNVRNLSEFFPWSQQDESARLNTGSPPLEAQQALLLDQMLAGVDYARAYGAAFANERVENVLMLKVPTRVVRWEGSMIRSWMQEYDNHDCPDHIHIWDCPPTVPERQDMLLQAYQELALGGKSWQQPLKDFKQQLSNCGAGWFYMDGEAPLHWYGAGEAGCSSAVLLLHDLGASGVQFAPLLEGYSGDEWVLAPDLPGHGRSASGEAQIDIKAAAKRILASLSELGISEVRTVGIGLGAAVGKALADLRIDLFGNQTAIDAVGPAPLPDILPRWGGGHLLEIWYALRDRQLYYPWDQRTGDARLRLEAMDLDAEQMQSELLDMLAAAQNINAWHAALTSGGEGSFMFPEQVEVKRFHWRTHDNRGSTPLPARIGDWSLSGVLCE